MNRKLGLLLALTLVVALAAPAMGVTMTSNGSFTWLGGDAAAPNDFTVADNWVGGVVPSGSQYWSPGTPDYPNGTGELLGAYLSDITLDNTATNNTISNIPNFTVGNVTLNRTGGATLNGAWYWGTVAVQTADTYTINAQNLNHRSWGWPANTAWAGNDITYNVVAGGTLNVVLNDADNWGNVTFAGAGTTSINANSNRECSGLTGTPGSTGNIFNDGWTVIDSAGGTGGTINIAGGVHFTAANYNSASQLVVSSRTYCPAYSKYLNGNLGFDTPGTTEVTGAKICLAGSLTDAQMSLPRSNSTTTLTQTYTDSTFSGDGRLNGTDGDYCNGQNYSQLISKGSTFAPSNTNSGSGNNNAGMLDIFAHIVCNQNAAGKNTQFVFAVTGTTGTQTKTTADYTSLMLGKPIWGGAGDPVITSVDSTGTPLANNLASADLVINITPGLEPKSGTAYVDPFASQILTVIQSNEADGANFATSTFANVKFVGGSGTVSYVGNQVQISNLWSNPTLAGDVNNDGLVDVADYNVWAANVGKTAATPEPISMIILAIGGGFVALKRKRA